MKSSSVYRCIVSFMALLIVTLNKSSATIDLEESVPKVSPVDRELHPCPTGVRGPCPPGTCKKLSATCKVTDDCCDAAKKTVVCRKRNALSRVKQCFKK